MRCARSASDLLESLFNALVFVFVARREESFEGAADIFFDPGLDLYGMLVEEGGVNRGGGGIHQNI